MPTATARGDRHTQALKFAVRGVAWGLGLFGVIRLGWVEAHVVLPLTQLQTRVAERAFGAPALPIDVTLACSGADALALCTGAILAYPATWRMRIGGTALGIGAILALNTVRIGTLGRAAASPSWFETLHLYGWPALLTLAIAGYVFTWMRFADTRCASAASSVSPTPPSDAGRRDRQEDPQKRASGRLSGAITRRFVWLSAAFLVLFVGASPLYLESSLVLAVAAFIARAAAGGLRLLGIPAFATANVLSTTRGAFLVTQECIATPLIPVCLAAVFAASNEWRWRALALLAVVPLFVGLGIARLLVVALPAALIGSPLFLVHAFYQILLAAAVVLGAAVWRHGAGATAWRRALVGGVAGALLAYVMARACGTEAFASGAPLDDPQGAMAFLPAFQLGLFVALSVAAFVVLEWRPFVSGLALLGISQIALFAALHLLLRPAGLMPHVRDVRAWALAGPLIVVFAMVAHARPHR